MEKTYRNISYFVLFLFIVVLVGFYKSYFRYYEKFDSISVVKHSHIVLLTAWFGLLILQPLLIHFHKQKLHKAIGKSSYFLAPFIIYSIFLVAQEKFQRLEHEVSLEQNIGEMTVNICSMFYFGLLFVMAIYYKKNTAYHMRYMIASALLLLDPGLGRIFTHHIGTSFDDSVVYSVIITEVFTLALILIDIRKGNQYKPYLITLSFLASFQVLWALRYSEPWQWFGRNFAELFF